MQNILLTGATGFIGQRMMAHLIERGYCVRALTRRAPSASSEVEWFEGDLTQPDTLQGACTSVDTVFHLGGFAHAFAEDNPRFAEQHQAINFFGTKNIVEEAIRASVKRFIYFSSVKAVADSEQCIDESFTHYPSSPYGVAKREAEAFLLSEKTKEMHVCILRPALVYGPAWKGNLNAMLKMIQKGLFPPLPNVKNSRSMIGIDDLCEAAILAARHPQANRQIYFVTDSQSYSTRAMYEMMLKVVGKKRPHWSVPFWMFRCLAKAGDIGQKILARKLPFNSDALSKLFGSAEYSSKRIQHELGFQPTTTFDTMLPAIIAAQQGQGN